MDIDDQLAALAADELDADEARALMARVESDPSLRRRLDRLRRLDQLLGDWDVAPMAALQVQALDEAVAEALDALDDGPIARDRAPVTRLRPLHDRAEDSAVAPPPRPGPSDDRAVVDLGLRRRGLPSWASGLVAAAAALAVVGTIGVGLNGFGGAEEDAAVMADAEGGVEDDDTGMEESAAFATEADEQRGAAADGADVTGETTVDSLPQGSVDVAPDVPALTGPILETALVLDRDSLATLADDLALPRSGAAAEAADEADGGVESGVDSGPEERIDVLDAADREFLDSGCLDEAIAAVTGSVVFIGTGSYEGVAAVVVIGLPAEADPVASVTAAYDASTCELLDEVVTER